MHGAPSAAYRPAMVPRLLFGRALNLLQIALFGVALLQFLRCAGPPRVWVGLALALPLCRFLISLSYRQCLLAHIRREWAAIEAFASERVAESLRDSAGTRGAIAPPQVRLPWRATAWLIVLPAALFFLTQRPLMTGDSKPTTLIASALVSDGTTDLSAFLDQYRSVYHVDPTENLPYFCVRTKTGIHSAYHSGMFVFALPSALCARMLGADLYAGGVQDRMEKGVACGLAAVCLGLFFVLALHRADAPAAAWMTLLLALGSGLCSTVGAALWQHGGVVFWMLLTLLLEFRSSRHSTVPAALLQGAALAMMFACRLPSAVFIAVFGTWLLVRSPRRALLVALSAALAYGPWAWYYHSIYGHILGPSIRQLELFTGHWGDTLIPLLFSLDHGLLVYQPWILLGLLLAVPRLRQGVRADVPWGCQAFCLAAIGLQVMLVAFWYCWWGGQCWGSRLLVETIPLLALLCLPAIAALHPLLWGRRLLLATAIVSALVQLPGVYLKVDFRDCQPALVGTQPEPPGSWKHVPFLTPFVGSLHSFR